MTFQRDDFALAFEVAVRVRYVDDFESVNYETYQKEVTVYVQDASTDGGFHFIAKPIEMSRTFAYNNVGS